MVRAHSAAKAVRTLAMVLSLTATSGCVGPLNVLSVEEDAGAIFCTFEHYRWPSDDKGTVRSSDNGITWTRIHPGGEDHEVRFVCRCRAGLLAELHDESWYRSTDRGESWEPVKGLEGSRRSGPTRRGDSELIFLGTEDGVVRSTDGGKSWTNADTVGLGHNYIKSIAATPTAVFVVAENISAWTGDPAEWGFYRSTDTGRSWVNLTNSLPVYLVEGYRKHYGPSCVGSDTTLFMFPSHSTDMRPYRSDDNGNSWTKIVDPDVIRLFEYDTSLLACIQTDTGNAMLVSNDAARTWNSHGGSPPQGCVYVQAYPSGRGLFISHHSESADNTIYRSRDEGRTWEKIRIVGF